jgi:hypothetical protein
MKKGVYPCEKHEVLEASVEMCFFLEFDNHLKMRVVYVRIHPEQALEDRLDDVAEVWREGSPCLQQSF